MLKLGNLMRKSALFVAVALAAALSTSTVFAATKKADPAVSAQQNTNKFIADAMNPGMTAQKAAKPAKKAHHKKVAKKGKKSAKKKM
jgi:hypothetical protein